MLVMVHFAVIAEIWLQGEHLLHIWWWPFCSWSSSDMVIGLTPQPNQLLSHVCLSVHLSVMFRY